MTMKRSDMDFGKRVFSDHLTTNALGPLQQTQTMPVRPTTSTDLAELG